MSTVSERAVELVRRAGEQLTRGLTDAEVVRVERRFEVVFAPDHRAFLQQALPVGNGWPDWRDGDPAELDRWLRASVDGVLVDVAENGFWPASWGARPTGTAEATVAARRQLRDVPVLVPLFGHRHLPAAPAPSGAPVFSMHQTDVVRYGSDIADWATREFARTGAWSLRPSGVRIAFWSDLAEGAEDADL